MALRRPAPSSNVPTSTFHDGLKKFLSGPDFAGDTITQSAHLGQAPVLPSEGQLTAPNGTLEHGAQELFILRLEDIKAGKDLTAATSAGWRYFAGNAPGPVVVGYVIERPPGGQWKLNGVTFGARPLYALRDSQALDSLAQVQSQNYDLRLLQVPGLNLEAFWLVGLQGQEDLLVPSPSGASQLIRGLKTRPAYTASEFLSIVRPLADSRLNFAAPYGS